MSRAPSQHDQPSATFRLGALLERWSPWLLAASCLGACQPVTSPESKAQAQEATRSASASAPIQRAPRGTRFPLTIIGYNYTQRNISSFSVNYAGGDLVEAGGVSGSVCCGSWVEGDPRPTRFKVEWVTTVCVDPEDPSQPPVWLKTYRKERRSEWVNFQGPVPAKPHYLEAHFFPDGKVEIAITEQSSEPRLRVDPATISRDLPLCSDTK